MMRSLATFRRLTWKRRLLLLEALLFLSLSSLAVKWLPFRLVMKLAERVPSLRRPPAGDAEPIVSDIRWAVEAWAARLPWRTVCFQIGLAVHLMLRLRGLPAVLHYGVRQNPEKGLQAHVWITRSGHPVVGVDEAAGFRCLLSVPSTDVRP